MSKTNAPDGLSFAEIDALFDEALQLGEPERTDFLLRLTPGQRERVEGLIRLAHHGDIDDMAVTVKRSMSRIAEPPATATAENAGPWKLQQELGSGGMGQVFLAVRDEGDYVQHAAVKVLREHRVNANFRARFFRERRILASLDHPGLARFLDGGLLDDGRPWFAMEYVKGTDVIAHAGELGLRGRLELFLSICATVAFAHERLIIHRDIKPHNILIDESGRSRLLDFGVAGIIGQIDDGVNTRTGGSPLTLQYASPEQVTGDLVTVGSDVYQLGLLLYQILTARVPYKVDTSSLQNAIETICEVRPKAPSASTPGIARDLDAIVLFALRKDPSQRYRSVTALADDVRRYLNGHPVRARPHSRLYVARRFVQRNAMIVGVIGVSVVALAAATLVSIDNANEARAEARRSQATQKILADVFQQADPFGSEGAEVSLADALITALPTIREQVADDPRLAWEVNKTLADIFTSLDLIEQEIATYEAALAAARKLGGDNEREIVLAVAGLGNALVRTNPADAAAFFQAQLPPAPIKDKAVLAWLSAKYAQINALTRLEDYAGADLGVEHMAQVVERFDISSPRTRGRLSQLLARSARRAGDIDAADAHWRDAADYMQKANKPAAQAVILSNMGQHFGLDGRFEEADAAFQQSLAVFAKHSPNDASHASVLRNYARMLFRTGRQSEAIDKARQALAILEGQNQAYASYTAYVDLATLTLASGQTGQTIEAVEHGLGLALSEFGRESAVTRRILDVYARVLLLGDRHDAARGLLRFNTQSAIDNSAGDQRHLFLAHADLDAQLLDDAAASLARARNAMSAQSRSVRLRLSCALGDKTALDMVLQETRQDTAATDDEARHLRLWASLAAAAQAVQAGTGPDEAIGRAADDYRDARHVFLDVLDRWRLLRALEHISATAQTRLPQDLRDQLVALERVRSATRAMLDSGRGASVQARLTALTVRDIEVGAGAAPPAPAFCAPFGH